jgi:hypothetical protein
MHKASYSIALILLFIAGHSFAQKIDFNELVEPFKKVKKSKVLIVGTFHFRDAGLDGYKPKFSVNIKSEQRQAEVLRMVESLAKFKPTKIAIENQASRQKFHDSLYGEFLKGRYALGENEIFQLCYRLAAKMGHQKIYTADAPQRNFSPEPDPEQFAKVHHQENYSDKVFGPLFMKVYSREDSLKSVLSLRDMFYHMNSPERLNLGMGHYIIGDFKVGTNDAYPGADQLTGWFNRNARIFARLLQLAAESDDERVLFVVGSGHVPILRFLALACPEIELVDAQDYFNY